MKASLICPSPRAEISALSQTVPLATLPMLGKSLLEYWLEHLAGLGATHVQVMAADRPEVARRIVDDGARWGLRAEVIVEPRELSPGLARTKYPVMQKSEWLPEPHDMVAMLHLPGQPERPLFNSYAEWFSVLMDWLPLTCGVNRIGMREIKPGVWVAQRAHISPDAKLSGPCWIGEDVTIGPRSVIGPNTVLEDRAWVEADCEISGSFVGPETLVGKYTELKESLATGNTLVNWKTSSVATVDDPFILCSLGGALPKLETASWKQQLAAIFSRTKEDADLVFDLKKMKLP
jgi:NDP-sugar pyrophosphorylase family protein